ncbi:MAG: four helix bundle protein [Pyrinomonadaceae bacterium]
MKVTNYTELFAWQKAMDLVIATYQATKAFPSDELYSLTKQLRRAVVSIPSNIAEGQGRTSTREFLHHLSIAYGSLRETETQILIAERLRYLPKERSKELIALCGEVGRIINGLAKSLSS